MKRPFALSLGLILACSAAHAGIANDIPSCYVVNRMPVSAPATELELFVMVDQTTLFDDTLQGSIRENVGRLIKANSAYVIAGFSSYAQGRYLNVLSAGTIEGQIAPKLRDDISVKQLGSFDACMARQLDFGRRTAATALQSILSGAASDIAKSDILGSLKEMSGRVRESKAKDKVLFLASDMLENSGVTSFYSSRAVRMIDPAAELKKAEAARLIGDFGGARVFVLGAGLVQEDRGGKHTQGVYRDPKTINALRAFWEKYFAASNAKLEEFGAPALLSPVR